ncbi:MAG: hypothetical protein AABZ60_22300, partial [Planctomycetota bacterium]
MSKYFFVLISFSLVAFLWAQEQIQIELVFSDGSAVRGFLMEENEEYYQVQIHQQLVKITKKDIAKVNKLSGNSNQREDKIHALREEMKELTKKTIHLLQEGHYEEAEKGVQRLKQMQRQIHEWKSIYTQENEKKLNEERRVHEYQEKMQQLKKEV